MSAKNYSAIIILIVSFFCFTSANAKTAWESWSDHYVTQNNNNLKSKSISLLEEIRDTLKEISKYMKQLIAEVSKIKIKAPERKKDFFDHAADWTRGAVSTGKKTVQAVIKSKPVQAVAKVASAAVSWVSSWFSHNTLSPKQKVFMPMTDTAIVKRSESKNQPQNAIKHVSSRRTNYAHAHIKW
jgi:hypothetical protein